MIPEGLDLEHGDEAEDAGSIFGASGEAEAFVAKARAAWAELAKRGPGFMGDAEVRAKRDHWKAFIAAWDKDSGGDFEGSDIETHLQAIEGELVGAQQRAAQIDKHGAVVTTKAQDVPTVANALDKPDVTKATADAKVAVVVSDGAKVVEDAAKEAAQAALAAVPNVPAVVWIAGGVTLAGGLALAIGAAARRRRR